MDTEMVNAIRISSHTGINVQCCFPQNKQDNWYFCDQKHKSIQLQDLFSLETQSKNKKKEPREWQPCACQSRLLSGKLSVFSFQH